MLFSLSNFVLFLGLHSIYTFLLSSDSQRVLKILLKTDSTERATKRENSTSKDLKKIHSVENTFGLVSEQKQFQSRKQNSTIHIYSS